MYRTFFGKTPVYQFDIFKNVGDVLAHAVFTRETDIDDRAAIGQKIGSQNSPVFFEKQLHGIETHLIRDASNKSKLRGDALMTKTSDIPLGIRIADCGSVLVYDPVNHAIANIHAGWRGLAARIIRKTLQKMSANFGSKPSDLKVGISPMLGPCCSVFSDPQNELPKFLHNYITEENTVNLWAIAEAQLRECGVESTNIENPRICTACNPEDFFSWRRGDKSKRFGTIISLKDMSSSN